MSTEQSRSPVQFFAELGDLLVQYATRPGYAIGMVVVSWIWPIGALTASLLVASAYVQSRELGGPSAMPGPAQALRLPNESTWLILFGLLSAVIGIFWLIRIYLAEFSFAFAMIATGILLILLGIARRGGAPNG